MINSKLADLLANNLENHQIVAEMITHIGLKNDAIADRLVDLCLSSDSKFVTKDMLLKYMDKIKPLCMKYTSNIIDIDKINIVYVDNIAGEVIVKFKAKVAAWFKNKESANKGDSWYSVREEDDDHKFKGTYMTEFTAYISFKDIDLD